MKSILIVVPSLENGGTISTLKNTLAYVDRSQCDVDIFPITNSGPNYGELSKYATILGINIDNKPNGLKNSLRQILFVLVKAIKKTLCIIGLDISDILFKRVAGSLQKKEYDEVISFQEGQATRLVRFIHCKKKTAWVHCDYSTLGSSIIKKEKKDGVYNSFHRIICVSEYTRSRFISIYPEYENKVKSIHNLMSPEVIKEKSKEIIYDPDFFDFKEFKIVSVGRLAPVKQFSLIPAIASRIREKGLSFCWFIIGGDDSDKVNIEYNIEKYKVSDNVKLVGNKNNPYPYILSADLLVCTSLSEACPNVINESKILGIPVISTNFGSAIEMLEDGEDGLIVTLDMLDQAIIRLHDDEVLYKSIKEHLHNYEYDNSLIMSKIEDSSLLRFKKFV